MPDAAAKTFLQQALARYLWMTLLERVEKSPLNQG
jgi:hypothetical protein